MIPFVICIRTKIKRNMSHQPPPGVSHCHSESLCFVAVSPGRRTTRAQAHVAQSRASNTIIGSKGQRRTLALISSYIDVGRMHTHSRIIQQGRGCVTNTRTHTQTQTQLSASLFGMPMTISTRAYPITPNAYSYRTLLLAFILGGIFFAKILPRFLGAVVLLWQHMVKLKQSKDKKIQFTPTGRQQRQNRKINRNRNQGRTRSTPSRRTSLVQFTRVPKSGLIALQYLAERLAGRSFQTQMRRALTEGLEQVSNPNIRSIDIHSFVTNPTPDKTPPRLLQGRIYHSDHYDMDNDVNNMMAFDVDIAWENCVDAELHVITNRLGLLIPIRLHDCKFNGSVRVILTPLQQDPPGFGACVVSFSRMPEIDLDVTVAGGQITKVAWLKEELMDTLQDLLKKEMVWPNRIVNPILVENFNVTHLSPQDIQHLEITDPFLELENQLMSSASPKRKSDDAKKTTTEYKTSLWNRVADGVLGPILEQKERWVQAFSSWNKNATTTSDSMVRGFVQSWMQQSSDINNQTNTTSPEKGQRKSTDRIDHNEDRDDDNNGWHTMMDKLVDRVVEPFFSSNSNETADIANIVEKMGDAKSWEEYMALFDMGGENDNGADDKDKSC